MIKKLLLGALSLTALNSVSQTSGAISNVAWTQYFSERSNIANVPSAIDAGNNVYQTGYTYSTASNQNATTIKYDAVGTFQFSISYDNGGQDNSKAIILDASGNFYITGESDGVGTGRDIFTAKYTALGMLVWVKRFNGVANANDVGNAITLDPSGNVFITGYTTNSLGNRDYVSIGYSAGGTQLFAVTFAGAGNGNDEAIAIAYNSSRLYITGTSVNASGNSDLVTLRLNPTTGATVWSKSENGTANSNDVAYALIADGNDVLIVGSISNTTTGNDYITVKYNGNNGNTLFNKVYDFINSNNIATALVKDATGNYAVTGISLNGTIYEYHTILYNNAGTQQWVNKTTTGLTYSSAMPQIATDPIANHFYICGQKLGVNSDIFVYQITPGGNKTWEELVNGAQNGQDAAVDLVVNTTGDIYVAGACINSTAKFDYATIKINQTPIVFPPDYTGQPASKQTLFLKNEGQIMNTAYTTATNVLYGTINQYPDIYIQKNSYNYVFQKEDTIQSTQDSIERIDVNFIGSNSNARHYDYNPKGIFYNYYLGHAINPSITDLRANERVFIPNYYPNIDLHYYSNKDGLKYYFVVRPGAKIDVLRLNIAGAITTTINGSNNLFIDGVLGDITLKQPIAYNINMSGNVVPLSGNSNWLNVGGNDYRIVPTTYNNTLPLVIMVSTNATPSTPSGIQANLDYSTYYGGSVNDIFNDVAIVNSDRYVTGNTTSGLFPSVNSQNFYSGSTDVILLKYTADDTLRYATFQGGSAQDIGNTVVGNMLGEIFVGGQTFSTDMYGLNVTGATNQFNNGGASTSFKADGFISKFKSVGAVTNNTLVWRRYVGGSGSETINSLYCDGANNLYMAGYSSSFDFPIVNAFKATLGPTTTANPSNTDAIFGRFNPNNTAVWITYYGGSSNASGGGTATQDWGNDIIVDASGNVIGCGLTDANNLQTTNTTGNTNTFFDNTIDGFSDGFIVRYSASGTPDFSSYFGGNNSDNLTRLAIRAGYDDIYFAGETRSTANFPFVNQSGAYYSTYTGGQSTAFLGYMNSNLTKQWNTYYGKGQVGTRVYTAGGLAVDYFGVTYLSGYTTSDTLVYPTTAPVGVYTDNTRSGDDGYIAIFNGAHQIHHAHYFGGASNDHILNSALDQNAKLYVTGYAQSSNFPIAYTPTTATLVDSTYNGGQDGFISRFNLAPYQVIGIQKYNFDNTFLTVFPNPANNQFNIQLADELKTKATLKVYSTMGQLIFEKEITDKNTAINCESWANGIYLLNINNNQTKQTFKLIKQ